MTVRQHSIDKMRDWMPNAASSYKSSRNYDLDGKQLRAVYLNQYLQEFLANGRYRLCKRLTFP